jgi:hypothetical protein
MINDLMSKGVKVMSSTSAVGFDLACIVKQTLERHEQGPCKFKEGALSRIIASPEFYALQQLIEDEQEVCPLKGTVLSQQEMIEQIMSA